MEKHLEHQKELFHNFTDLKKAFYGIWHDGLCSLERTSHWPTLWTSSLMCAIGELIGTNGWAIKWDHSRLLDSPNRRLEKSPFQISAKQVTIVVMTLLIVHQNAQPYLFSLLPINSLDLLNMSLDYIVRSKTFPPAIYNDCSSLRSCNFVYVYSALVSQRLHTVSQSVMFSQL